MAKKWPSDDSPSVGSERYCNIYYPHCKELKRGAGRRIRTDDLLITNQLLYQLSYAGTLRAETPPSAAISVLTVYAIFYGMPVGAMSAGQGAKRN
jgi:hypothetical protein